MRIDLNADLGEGMGDDDAMLDVVTSANIACGGHAGDHASMAAACSAAAARGVRIGAHVSYPDVARFGRVELEMAGGPLREELLRQTDALCSAAAQAGTTVAYLKPHGALYHRITGDPEHARAVVEVALAHGLAVLGLPGALVLDLAAQAGLATYREAFADRGYRADGSLVPRTEPGAVLDDAGAVADRMVSLVRDGAVTAIDGTPVAVTADSICVHGDTSGAVAIAVGLRAALTGAGARIAPFG